MLDGIFDDLNCMPFLTKSLATERDLADPKKVYQPRLAKHERHTSDWLRISMNRKCPNSG